MSFGVGMFNISIRSVLSCLIVALIACGKQPDQTARGAKVDDATREAVNVAVELVRLGEAASFYTTTASIEAEFEAEIRSRSEGVVKELLKEEGDVVESGDLLAVIDDSDQILRLKQAELTAEQARGEYRRSQRMEKAGVLPADQFELTENALKQAEAELELATLALSYTRVNAPFAGTITGRLIDVGANISPAAALFNIMDMDPLLVKVHVPATRMGKVAVGQDVDVHVESVEAHLTGRIRLISPVVDPATGTVKVTVEIDSYPGTIRPGDFVNVRLVTERNPEAMLVPTTAVIEDQGSHHVFIATDNRAVKRVVVIGFADQGATEIRSGLEGNEQIVVKGQRNLRDGMPIEIIRKDGELTAASESEAGI